jgi:hypothetical protein
MMMSNTGTDMARTLFLFIFLVIGLQFNEKQTICTVFFDRRRVIFGISLMNSSLNPSLILATPQKTSTFARLFGGTNSKQRRGKIL